MANTEIIQNLAAVICGINAEVQVQAIPTKSGTSVSVDNPVIDQASDSEVILDVLCNVDENLEDCPGRITYVYGNLCTQTPTRRVSACTTRACNQISTAPDTVGLYGTTVFNASNYGDWAVGDVMPAITGPITFTIQKKQRVEFGGLWSWLQVNSQLDTLLEISIDGGAFFAPSGGGNDESGASSALTEPYRPEHACLEMEKGVHTIEIRWRVIRAPSAPNSGPTLISRAAANFWVNYTRYECNEVTI
jgi:hypothetical protein